MKKVKNNKKVNKQETIKYINEDTNQIKKFIFILVGVALIALLLYFVTAKFLVKDKFQKEVETKEETNITYDTLSIGNVFNRPYETYYIMAFDSTSLQANYYDALINNYTKDKIYFLDLSLEVNKKYVKETSNPEASKPSELALKEPTLILIKDGKISKYFDDIASIEKEIG